MGTHAIFTVTDEDGSFHVFKHSDGYERGAADTLRGVIELHGWELPRFEADEFAAAIATSIKAEYLMKELEFWRAGNIGKAKEYQRIYNQPSNRGGSARLVTSEEVEAWSVEYHYKIKQVGNRVVISTNDGPKVEIRKFIETHSPKKK